MKSRFAVALLMSALWAFTFTFALNSVHADTLCVPDDYPTIQLAVDAASPGDTIEVRGGTYEPFVVTTDRLDIRAADEGDRPVVDGSNNPGLFFGVLYYAVNIDADECRLEGFDVVGTTEGSPSNGYGILVTGDGNRVSGNSCTGNVVGIIVFGLHRGGVWGNRACENFSNGNVTSGIEFVGSMYGEIEGNVTIANGTEQGDFGYGILSVFGEGNTICDNFASECPQGIAVQRSTGETIEKNAVMGNVVGFNIIQNSNVLVTKNDAFGNVAAGISLALLDGSTISKNKAAGTVDPMNEVSSGFRCTGLTNCVVEKNQSTGNAGNGFTIQGAVLRRDGDVVFVGPSTGNIFQKNNADGNGKNGFALQNYDRDPLPGTEVTGNEFEKNSSGHNGEYGFVVDAGSTDNVFDRNKCEDNMLGGANIDGVCDCDDDNEDDD